MLWVKVARGKQRSKGGGKKYIGGFGPAGTLLLAPM